MSKQWRIALVAEGPTDLEIIQAALKAVLPDPFIMTQLQPEATQPDRGTGWGGVLKWCHQSQQRHSGPLLSDPTLSNFDLIIIHLDADVAHCEYSDVSYSITEAEANTWEPLPCDQPCPPVSNTIYCLQNVLNSWLGQIKPDNRTVLCLPAQSSGTWLAVAVLSPSHPFLANAVECDRALENRLAQLPIAERIKKTTKIYRQHAPQITANWSQVKQSCDQAKQFENDLLTAIQSLPP